MTQKGVPKLNGVNKMLTTDYVSNTSQFIVQFCAYINEQNRNRLTTTTIQQTSFQIFTILEDVQRQSETSLKITYGKCPICAILNLENLENQLCFTDQRIVIRAIQCMRSTFWKSARSLRQLWMCCRDYVFSQFQCFFLSIVYFLLLKTALILVLVLCLIVLSRSYDNKI